MTDTLVHNMLRLLKCIESMSSTSGKLSILRQRKDDILLQQICVLALSPMIQFYIKKIPKYSYDDTKFGSISVAVDGLSALSSRQVTGNNAIQYLAELLSSIPPDDAKVIERIIKKDLKCGINIATVNKVWPDLIPTYPCMLCSPYSEKWVNKITFPAFVQTKEDGMRFNAIVKDGVVEFRTRNGKYLNFNLPQLNIAFITMANGNDEVYDGELLVRDETGHILDRQTGNGILNKAVKGTISDEEASMICCKLWDYIPYKHWITGKYDESYEFRFNTLCTIVDDLHQYSKIVVVDTYVAEDMDEVSSLFKQHLDDGMEGIILKDMSSIWEDKRSTKQIKFKGWNECELRVVGWQEGTGKYVGMLGALQCCSEDGIIKVSVGSGFTDEDRKFITRDIIGDIITVKYNSRIVDVNGNESLFLPIFVEIREDKSVANCAEDIT